MEILKIMPFLNEYIELLPICFVGIVSGCINYLQVESAGKKETIRIIITSSFLTILTYAILTSTSLPYLACVGISAAVGYFGIDKAIELAQKLLSLKGSKEGK